MQQNTEVRTPTKPLIYALRLVILFISYIVTARFGLLMNPVNGFATLIWPPSGIALAFLLLYGRHLWPAITLGAFVVNHTAGASFFVACGIAVGNTLEAVLAVYLLQNVAGFHNTIDRLKDVVSFGVFGAFTSTIVAATMGAISLWLGDRALLEGLGTTWWAWWVGDAMGDLIVAPLILSLATWRYKFRFNVWRILEGLILLSSLITVGMLVFGTTSNLAFWFFPFVVWAALRFGQIGNVIAIFFISIMAIWGTANGLGPFSKGLFRDNLLFLHSFMTVVASTGLMLAASIAEKKRSMKAARNERLQKGAIVIGALDCIVSMDHEGKVREFNPAAERTFGYTRAEVLGLDMAETLIPARFREAHRQGLMRQLATGQSKVLGRRVELIALRKDGSEFPAELTITRMPLKGLPMFTGFIRDISEQKSLEEDRKRLMASEEWAKRRLKLQYLVMSVLAESKSMSDGITKVLKLIAQELNWDLGAFWLVNEEAKEIKAIELYKAENVAAPEFVEATQNGSFPKGKGLPGRIWQTGAPTWIIDVTDDSNFPRCMIAKKEGLHGAFGFPILSGDKVLGVMEFFSRELRMPDEELLHSVSVSGGQIGLYMNRLLAEAALREAVRARDEFLSIASHELKTPITSLSLQIQMTKQKINPAVNAAPPVDKLAKVFDISERQVNRLTGLIEDLLDASRIQTGRFSFNFSSLNLSEVVLEIVDRFAGQLKKADCSLTTSIQENVMGCLDHSRFEQIIDNLLSNAVKYAPGKPVLVALSSDGRAMKLVVEDQGPGIPLDKQTRIFERFERVNSATNVSGLGLGLFIVREIVRGHGGVVSLESSEGVGSRFVVELPLVPPATKKLDTLSL